MYCALTLIAGRHAVKRVCDVLGVARSNVAANLARPADWHGRSARKKDDAILVEVIRVLIAAFRATLIGASGVCCGTSVNLAMKFQPTPSACTA
jgi:hypothetical protein